MKKSMLAAEQPPETESEVASDQVAGGDPVADAIKQSSAMAAAWAARRLPAATLGDHEGAAIEDDGCTPVTTRLKPSVHDYLVQRARMHGETPEQHLGTILRAFRQTDPLRPDLARLPPADVGMPAMARPR